MVVQLVERQSFATRRTCYTLVLVQSSLYFGGSDGVRARPMNPQYMLVHTESADLHRIRITDEAMVTDNEIVI